MLPTIRRTGRLFDSPFDLLSDEWGRMLRNGAQNTDDVFTAAYPVDIREDADHVYVDAELPGFKRDEIEVTLEDGILTIRAERKIESDPKSQAHLTERRYTRVARAFTIPTRVDEGKVDAKLDSGVLRITLNKREEVKPRKIEVK